MGADGPGDEGDGNDMDGRVSKWLGDALKYATVLVGTVIYVERRAGSLELHDALTDERDRARDMRTESLEGRIDRIDAAAASRLDIGADGGFGHVAVRAMVNATIRGETKHLASLNDLNAECLRLRNELRGAAQGDIAALKAELRGLLERIVAINQLKMPQ